MTDANPLHVTVTEHADPHAAQLRSIAQALGDGNPLFAVWAKELREAATAYEQVVAAYEELAGVPWHKDTPR